MKLYRDFILASALRGAEMFRTIPGVRGLQRVDFEVTAAIAAEAHRCVSIVGWCWRGRPRPDRRCVVCRLRAR